MDTGVEVNVLDETTAIKAGIGILNTNELAQATNKLSLDIRGQSSLP